MQWDIYFLLSLSIVPAAVIGIVRYRQIDRSYYPFIYDIWAVVLVEVAVFFTKGAQDTRYEVGITNVFSLADALLFTWLFFNWSLFRRKRAVLVAVLAALALLWLVTTLMLDSFWHSNLYFRPLYSFCIVFFSVSMLNKVIVQERGNILRNSKFLICLGLIIFYTIFGILCVTNLSVYRENIGISDYFRGRLQVITVYSNLFVNLLYAIAVLWVPRKKSFINPF